MGEGKADEVSCVIDRVGVAGLMRGGCPKTDLVFSFDALYVGDMLDSSQYPRVDRSLGQLCESRRRRSMTLSSPAGSSQLLSTIV